MNMKTFAALLLFLPAIAFGHSVVSSPSAVTMRGQKPDGSIGLFQLSQDGSALTEVQAAASQSVAFETTTNLGNAEVYDSGVLAYDNASQVQTEVLSDQDGTMTFTFYSDDAGTDQIRQLTVPYSTADGYRQFGAPTFGRSVRYQFANGATPTTDFFFSTKFISTAISPQVVALDAFISPSMLSTVQRSVLSGQTSQGTFGNVGIDQSGNLSVSIRQPTEAFGAVLVSDLHPQVQRKFVSGLNDFMDETIDHDGGMVSASTGQLVLSTSTTTSSKAQYISRDIGSYRPGQAVVHRFTMQFDTSAAATEQIIGVGDAEDGLFFGYNGTSFGVMRRTGGQAEIRTITVTGKPSGAGTVTVTLNGGAVETELDGTESIAEAAAKIAASDYDTAGGGWRVRYMGDQVVFIAIDTDTRGGSYSFVDTDTTAATATEAQTLAASDATETWTARTAWNTDPADATQELPSLDFSMGQVAEIQYQWLGYGAILYRLENPATGRFVTVHEDRYANTATSPSLRQPDLYAYASVDNQGTTTNLTMRSGSIGMFIAGEPPARNLGVRFSQSATLAGTATRTNVLVIRVGTSFSGATNRTRVFLDGMTFGNNSSNRTAEFHITRNPDLVGAPSWTSVDATNSVVSFDTTTTDIVAGSGERLLTSVVGAADGVARDLDREHLIELSPGDILVVSSALASGGSGADVVAGFTWVEGV